jgi:hypothetical protein
MPVLTGTPMIFVPTPVMTPEPFTWKPFECASNRDFSSLLEHRPAGIAETGLLPPQAGGDGANVGDFAGAKTVDVGRAGPSLLRRCQIGQRRACAE